MAEYGEGLVPEEKPRRRRTWLTIVIVLVVLCCIIVVCGGGGYALWEYGDQILEYLSDFIGGF